MGRESGSGEVDQARSVPNTKQAAHCRQALRSVIRTMPMAPRPAQARAGGALCSRAFHRAHDAFGVMQVGCVIGAAALPAGTRQGMPKAPTRPGWAKSIQ